MEGGEEDLQEFEKAFVDDNSVPENRKPANGKGIRLSIELTVCTECSQNSNEKITIYI